MIVLKFTKHNDKNYKRRLAMDYKKLAQKLSQMLVMLTIFKPYLIV